jgi:hypothetical protein
MTCADVRRPLTVIATSLVIVAFSVVVVNASAMSTFCSQWHNSLEPTHNFWCDAFEWTWNGGYDITGMGQETGLETAAEICSDLTYSCWETCESLEYRQWALQRVNDAAWPNCEYGIGCITSWGNPSCQQGLTGSFSCTCSYFNVCGAC